ncbi:MAG: hypothetical protein QXP91_07830 [Candidatus Methanomethylicia archaeon]
MLYPNYRLEIGSKEFTINSQSITSITVKLGLGPKIDSCRVLLVGDDAASSIGRGDNVNVYLGYDDDLVKVFTGIVDIVDVGYSQVKVDSLSPSVNLLKLRLNRVYNNQTAGQIVSDLLSTAGVSRVEVMDGLSFPIYVIDDRLNAYEHIEKLARRCGFVFYTSSDGGLIFKKYVEDGKHTLKYGEDILAINMVEMVEAYGCIKVFGESPSSMMGSETYHWLTKREIVGESGSGHTLIIQDFAIKDKGTAENVAQNVLDNVKKSFSIMLRIVGNANIKVNDTVEVKDMPEEKLNGLFQVVDVEHYLDKMNGFTSIITCRR